MVNIPNLSFSRHDNSFCELEGDEGDTEDDESNSNDDPTCPMITLTHEQKMRLRKPWPKALIVKLFERGIGYKQLQRSLLTEWAFKGDFALIDLGCDN